MAAPTNRHGSRVARPVPAHRPEVPDHPARRPARHGRATRTRERMRLVAGAFALMAPALLTLLAVSLYPVLRSIWLSFRDTTLAAQTDSFTGLKNYRLMWSDEQFWNAWRQTAGFTVASTLLETLIGLGIALVLSANFRG